MSAPPCVPRAGIHVDAGQCHLLRAILPGPEGPAPHYARWRECVDFEDLDSGSFRLLPMLFRSLEGCGRRDDLFERIKGVYRYTLFKNSLIRAHFRRTATALHEAGVGLMALKGGAMLLRYYPDCGVRPMNDIDILVRRRDARAAMGVLRGQGWSCSYAMAPERALGVYNSLPFAADRGFELDLHWRIMTEYGGRMEEGELWDAAVAVEDDGVPVRILSPEDQVMHACAHGVKWNVLPPIRWIPDLAAILRTDGRVMDWDRLARAAARRNLTTAVRACLEFLRDNFGLAGLDEPLRELARTSVPRREAALFRLRTSPPRRKALRDRLAKEWMFYSAVADAPDALTRLLRFPLYVRHKTGLDSHGEFARHVLRELTAFLSGRRP